MTPRADEKFALGDRVQMTTLARENGLAGTRRGVLPRGIVTSFHPRKPHLVRVRQETKRSGSSYHVDFWERQDDQPARRP